MMREFDLQGRLVLFSTYIIEVVRALPKTLEGQHFANQLIRSGTAPALSYAEAQGAESRKDFIHKMKIALKELRESRVTAIIIQDGIPGNYGDNLSWVLQESNELISIFVKSIETAKSNMKRNKLG